MSNLFNQITCEECGKLETTLANPSNNFIFTFLKCFSCRLPFDPKDEKPKQEMDFKLHTWASPVFSCRCATIKFTGA